MWSLHVFLKCLNPVFLGLVYQKHTLICTMKHIIVNNDKYSGSLLSCDVCETEIIIIVIKVLTCFTNIITIIPQLRVIVIQYRIQRLIRKVSSLDVIMPLTHMIKYIIITMCTLN